jgi:uncharacterized cupin superfamily protein
MMYPGLSIRWQRDGADPCLASAGASQFEGRRATRPGKSGLFLRLGPDHRDAGAPFARSDVHQPLPPRGFARPPKRPYAYYSAKSPTISTLAALAGALGVPLAALVEAAAAGGGSIVVERAAARPPLTDPDSGAVRDRIGPVFAGSGRIEIIRLRLPPRCVAGPFPAHAGGTLERIHLAQGNIHVRLGSEAVMLEAGDSCTCRSGEPHSFDNSAGDVAALICIVIEPPAVPDSSRTRTVPRRRRRQADSMKAYDK